MKDKGFILVNGENHISLTDEGLEVAERIYERHTILSKMLVSIGVSEATALEDACKSSMTSAMKHSSALKSISMNVWQRSRNDLSYSFVRY